MPPTHCDKKCIFVNHMNSSLYDSITVAIIPLSPIQEIIPSSEKPLSICAHVTLTSLGVKHMLKYFPKSQYETVYPCVIHCVKQLI